MRQRASTFPEHKFDFGDSVFVPHARTGGTVKGICHSNSDREWRYCVSGLSNWWQEDQIESACPCCLSAWDETNPCRCGHSPDE